MCTELTCRTVVLSVQLMPQYNFLVSPLSPYLHEPLVAIDNLMKEASNRIILPTFLVLEVSSVVEEGSCSKIEGLIQM